MEIIEYNKKYLEDEVNLLNKVDLTNEEYNKITNRNIMKILERK